MEREKKLRALLETSDGSFVNHLLISTGKGLVPENYQSSRTFQEVLTGEGISGVCERVFVHPDNLEEVVPFFYRVVSDQKQAVMDRLVGVGGYFLSERGLSAYRESDLMPFNRLYEDRVLSQDLGNLFLDLLIQRNS
jgi:hypothetical protein